VKVGGRKESQLRVDVIKRDTSITYLFEHILHFRPFHLVHGKMPLLILLPGPAKRGYVIYHVQHYATIQLGRSSQPSRSEKNALSVTR